MATETKKIVFIDTVMNANETFRYKGYVFGVDKNLKPIPQDVPLDIAEELLKIMTIPCRCNAKEVPRHKFAEITV